MRRHACSLLAVFALSGCSGSLFKTSAPAPRLYLLSAETAVPAAGQAPLSADLAILKPRIRAGLETDRIAALYPDQRLDYFADARWSGPLDEVLQDLMVQVSHLRAGMRTVSGDASVFASTHWLEISVIDFQAEYTDPQAAPTVHVHLQVRLGSAAERRIIGSFESDARQPAQGNRLRDIVAAYNLAANQALSDIARRCAQALGQGSKAE